MQYLLLIILLHNLLKLFNLNSHKIAVSYDKSYILTSNERGKVKNT